MDDEVCFLIFLLILKRWKTNTADSIAEILKKEEKVKRKERKVDIDQKLIIL